MDAVRERPPASGRSAQFENGRPEMLERAEVALAEPFIGVRTHSGRIDGLFPISPSGVSTAELVQRARSLLSGLDAARSSRAVFEISSDAWRSWSNIHRFLMRHGVLLEECSEAERELGLALVASALSDEGFASARNVMRLNDHLSEVSGRPDEFGEWLYWLSIFGEPSSTEPWGFQLDGHHVNLNCFLLGDQLVVSPFFLGSEPVIAEFGRHAGVSVLQEEEAVGIELLASLTAEERSAAVVSDELPRELFTAAFRDNVELDYSGVARSALSINSQTLLDSLISRYVGRIRPGHAERKMDEVRAHLDETYFCWMGGTGPEDAFYYRVQSPVILIEFDHQSGVVFDNDYPTRRHIHTVVRTPNGNDYGRDLLRQHYAEHEHTRSGSPHDG